MSFDCSKCLARCKADCCHGPVPMPKGFIDRHVAVRPIVIRKDFGSDHEIAMALDERTRNGEANSVMGVCPFLGFDDRCSIYEDRPDVCREFGSESHPMMICSYQSRDGRIRSRQEHRAIGREQVKRQGGILNKIASTEKHMLKGNS